MHHIIIINGRPRSGKDTTVNIIVDLLKNSNYHVKTESSIDPIKDVFDYLEVDLSKKNEQDRQLLSEVANALEKHSNFKTNKTINNISNLQDILISTTQKDMVFVTQYREPDQISRLKNYFKYNHEFEVTYLVIKSDREQVFNNNSDKFDQTKEADYVIMNHSSIECLRLNAQLIMENLNILDQQDITA